MDNTYRLLPWKKARKKRFNSVKAPKTRSVSSLDDMSDDSPRRYGSTTSLPTLPYDDLNPTDVQPASSSTDIQHVGLASSSTDIQHQGLDVTNSPSVAKNDNSFGSEQGGKHDLSTSSNDNSWNNSLNDASKSDSVTTNSSDYKEHSVSQREEESLKDDVFSESQTRVQSSLEPKQSDSPVKKDVQSASGQQNNPKSDKVNYGNNIIILNNVGVENANEYDRLHPRREDNALALLLQELDMLIKSLPESRQIGTPFSCSNFVAARLDHRGGRIRLPEPDVCLCIPPGAIPQGKAETVYMYIVNPRIPALSELGDEDHWLTPIVHCGPPGINFSSYVSLSLQSSVADESGWDFNVSRGVQPEYTEWENLENRDDSVVLVKSGRIAVLVDHFTPYGAKGKPHSGETVAKWMEAGVFVHPPCGETGEHEVQFHVRIWNISDRQRVLHEERKLLRTCLAEPIRAIRVYDSGCPVQVLVDEVRPLWVLWNHTGKTIPFHNLWREHHGRSIPDSPSITFVAQANQSHLSDWHRGSFRSTVKLFQEDHEDDGISFIVRANPSKMGFSAVSREGQLGYEYGTTYLKQQPRLDPYDSATPLALFPLSDERFHEVCLQLDGTPGENGEKIWRAFARTADLNRKDLDAIMRCAQQHQHKSPSDMLLTYFIGDPCRGFDTLRTLQEIWYVLYHIGNDGAREEIEEEMYEKMTTMKGRKKERQPSDISSGIDHPSELSSLVMTSDDQMSDLEDDFGKGEPLKSTAVADTKLTESAPGADQETLQQEAPTALKEEDKRPPNPLEEFVKSNKELTLHSEPTIQETALSSDPSQLQEPTTDISDDLELQLSEFSKHWAVSEDSLDSSSELSPSSEAELLKILLANDEPSRLTENGMLSFNDPQRQATELPLEFQPIKNEQSQELECENPSNVDDGANEINDCNIVIYMDDGTVVDFKPKPVVGVAKEVLSTGDEANKVTEKQAASTEANNPGGQRSADEATTPDESPVIGKKDNNISNTYSPQDESTESEMSIDIFSSSSDGHQATQENTREYTTSDIEELSVDGQTLSNVKSSKEMPDTQNEDENIRETRTTREIPNGHHKGGNVLKINITAPRANGEVHPNPPVNATRIAYETIDIDNDSSAMDPQKNTNNHNNVNYQPTTNGSFSLPMTNGTAVEGNMKGNMKKNRVTRVPESSKKRRNSPKSPKQEDRDCLRQLARLALMGKPEGDAEDSMMDKSRSSSASTSPQPPAFNFSLLQPVRNIEEEFV